MKWRIVALVALLGVAASSLAAANGPPSDLRVALLQPRDFQIRTQIKAIPNAAQAAFTKGIGDKTFSMAEPGQPWQVGSAKEDPRLFRRRLQRVLLSKAFCVLFYESGGRRKNNHVAYFRLTQSNAEFLGSTGNSYPPLFDLRRLLGAIDKGGVFEWIAAPDFSQ